MEIRIFAHSWLSDWNHGNAHFLRGWARALSRRGHRLRLFEALPGPWGDWSLAHLIREEPLAAMAAVAEFRAAYPELDVELYPPGPRGRPWLEKAVRHADVVIVHEWNRPELMAALVQLRRRLGFMLLFHDTHHRGHTQPAALAALPLREMDAVLAFGESLRRVYERRWGARAFTLHEAADEEAFAAPPAGAVRAGVLWVGNWGDGERSGALEAFLLRPAEQLPAVRFLAHGVRYPEAGLEALRARGIAFGGYLPNLQAAAAYRRCVAALHIPRAPYAKELEGIPTIRVFEALACGAALVSAPWNDTEGLFREGQDYLVAANGAECAALLRGLIQDPARAAALGSHGRSRILARHTCGHRAAELEAIIAEVSGVRGIGWAPCRMAREA
ncbi:MAG: CgeB family protein [Terriglobales bacterium]